MSRNNNNNKQPMKYCKVCHDAGKSEAEYRSHFVRASAEPGAKVVCPTLLAQECRYCFKAGHTAGYCPTIKANKKITRKEEPKVEKQPKTPVKKEPTNAFAALYDSDDDDKETEAEPGAAAGAGLRPIKTIDEFPALPTSQRITTKTEKKTNAVARPSCVAAIQTMYSGITVQKALPEVSTYRPPVGKLVRKRDQDAADQDAVEYQDEVEVEDEDEEQAIEHDYRARLAERPRMLASEMDWAAVDEDDEDW